MGYNPDFVEKVMEANNIIDIISQYTDLKIRGRQHIGLCPFPDHNEKTPSFSVSEGKQLYHCFGCKKSGNIFTFLESYNGFSFVEALEYLAAKVHLEMPKNNNFYKNREIHRDKKQQLFKANKLAAGFYHQKLKNLPKEHKLHAYLKKRHISAEMVEEFFIGYASRDWDQLTDYFNREKKPLSLIEKSGLIRKNKKGGYFDLFRDRLMFPIFSIEGHVIGFGGRIINQGEPKYINSPESDIFKKGQSFYGLDKSIKFIRSKDCVFVVEGYMDFVALYSQGIKNVVATLGTALTDKHISLLKRWTKNIVLLFDGDQAGRLAAQKSLARFFKENLSPKILFLPEKMDPDDFIHKFGKDAFLKKSQSPEDLFLKMWLDDYREEPAYKIQFLDKISPLLKCLTDSRLREMYIQELARYLHESPKKIYSWVFAGREKTLNLKKTTTAGNCLEPKDNPTSRISLDDAKEDELILLGLSLKSPKYMEFFINQQGLDCLGNKNLKQIFSQTLSKYRQEPESFDKLAGWVLSKIEKPEKITNLVNILSNNDDFNQEENHLKECFIRVKDRYLRHQGGLSVGKLKLDPTNTKLEQFVKIQNDRKALKELEHIPLGE